MLTEKTIHQFLNSVSVNMGRTEYSSIAKQLKSVPGLAEAVTGACERIRTKQRNVILRKISSRRHLADRIDRAEGATVRAIDLHRRAQSRLEELIRVSARAESRRDERLRRLHDEACRARNEADEYAHELAAFDAEPAV